MSDSEDYESNNHYQLSCEEINSLFKVACILCNNIRGRFSYDKSRDFRVWELKRIYEKLGENKSVKYLKKNEKLIAEDGRYICGKPSANNHNYNINDETKILEKHEHYLSSLIGNDY